MFEPESGTAGARLHELKRVLAEALRRGDPPSPSQYQLWYREFRQIQRQARGDLIQHCEACGKILRDTTGQPIIKQPDLPGRRKARRHCDSRCKKRAERRKYREAYPEKHKLAR